MAATVTPIKRQVPGANFRWEHTITGDSSYPNGTGYTFTAAQLGYSDYISAVIGYDSATFASAAFVPQILLNYNSDNITIASITLRFIQYATYAEVANATNLTTAVVTLITEGK